MATKTAHIRVGPTPYPENACNGCHARDFATTTRTADVAPGALLTLYVGPANNALTVTLCPACRAAVAALFTKAD